MIINSARCARVRSYLRRRRRTAEPLASTVKPPRQRHHPLLFRCALIALIVVSRRGKPHPRRPGTANLRHWRRHATISISIHRRNVVDSNFPAGSAHVRPPSVISIASRYIELVLLRSTLLVVAYVKVVWPKQPQSFVISCYISVASSTERNVNIYVHDNVLQC